MARPTPRRFIQGFMQSISSPSSISGVTANAQLSTEMEKAVKVTASPPPSSTTSDSFMEVVEEPKFENGPGETSVSSKSVCESIPPQVVPDIPDACLNQNGGANQEEETVPDRNHQRDDDDERDRGDVVDWREGLSDGECYFQISKSPIFENSLDAVFLVGPEKQVIMAHRIILAANCAFFEGLFGSVGSDDAIIFDTLDPSGFKILMEFIYTKHINLVEVTQLDATKLLLAGVDCARAISYKLFEQLALAWVRSSINLENALQMFALLKRMGHQDLEQICLDHINKDVAHIFQSDHFLALNRDDLALFLSSDEWYLPEMEVFEATIRWALHKISDVPTTRELASQLLRETMGEAFFQIRFLTLTPDEFTAVCVSHPKIFQALELGLILAYVISPELAAPPVQFVARPRKMPVPVKTSVDSTATATVSL